MKLRNFKLRKSESFCTRRAGSGADARNLSQLSPILLWLRGAMGHVFWKKSTRLFEVYRFHQHYSKVIIVKVHNQENTAKSELMFFLWSEIL